MLIDTHCHLHDKEFYSEKEAEAALSRAKEKGIEKIICIGTNHKDSLAAHDFAEKHKNIFWTYGIHPEYASEAHQKLPKTGEAGNEARPELPEIDFGEFKTPPIAIGEVGLDYHYEDYDRYTQIRLFEEMLNLATRHDLPLSFHIREAFDDFFGVIKNFPGVRGVVHSFSDNKKNLKRILTETDFYIGVNGMATYSTLPTPPLDRTLLETDAPFLTPIPFRGIMNEPSHIRDIALWLAGKLSIEPQIIEEETTKNARELFRFH
ncbi:TatD family hydrolase [Candidatus Saccharibacteria bacterium]|nr:TatD family hydrolase [Candidatus Saccharibacteria bacterium]